MSCIRFVAVLAALFVLAMPALSISYSGMGEENGQTWQGQDKLQRTSDSLVLPVPQSRCMQENCGCEKQAMCQDNKKTCGCDKSMTCQNENNKACCSERPMMGQDGNQKTCGCEKQEMGHDGKKTCGCQKSMVGQDNMNTYSSERPMMGQDGNQKTCGCQKSMMGQDENKVKSMMDDKCNENDRKEIRSMMGSAEKKNDESVKIVIVNVQVE